MRKSNGSIGGCGNSIMLIDKEHIASFAVKNGKVSITHVLDPVSLACSPKTVSFDEEQSLDDVQGTYYNVSVEGTISRIGPDISQTLAQLSKRKWLVFVWPTAGGCKVFGTPDYPMSLSYKNSVSADYGFNGYTLTFSGKSLEEAPFVEDVTRL